ncbi:extracellular solute-binding protein [Saliphagus infecundisoli]|uniref:Extracellular solute-binding protein n=1 Tax=Saliphagus infecundisoli TaxID=1849069 RepID=A0ABD5QJP0_9EURY|nr:extracellular solute-binding protein [Saliphagus infecundisoli]
MALDRVQRRSVVKALAAAGLLGTAGCLGDDGNGNGNGGNGNGGNGGNGNGNGGNGNGGNGNGNDSGNGNGGNGNDSGNGNGNGGASDLVTHEQFGPDDGTPLTFWAQPGSTPDPNEQPGSEVNAEGFRPAYEQWVEENPDYRINVEYQTDLEQMQTLLLQTAATGDAPDVSEVDSFWIPNHWNNLRPVTDVIEDEEDWYPFVRDIVQPEDEWLAVWRNTDCRGLYYRTDVIDEYADGEAPATWDELIEVGQAIADGEDMAAFMYNGGRWEATTFDNLAYFWGQGGELVDSEGAPILGEGDNYDYLLNVFEFFAETIETGITPGRVANIDDYDLLAEEALNDDLAMFLGGSWQINTNLRAELGDEADELWDVAPIPMPESDMAATGTGGWTYGVFTDDDDLVEPAMNFAGVWTDPEIMAHYCEQLGQLPTKPSVYEESDYFAEDYYMQIWSDLLESGVARPGFPIYRTISAEWQVAAGRVITGEMAPQEAIDNMIDNINAEYDG